MKRNVYRLLLLSIVVTMTMLVQAEALEYGVVLEESFEEGIPEDWTQDYSSIPHDWVVESGNLTRPNGAYEGTKRVVLRNETSTTIGYKTKLISPVMDLSVLFNPILKFAYAQDQWTSDFDTLRVYYRTDTTKSWTHIKTYSSYMSKWQYEIIKLTGKSSTYQIAFEGTDNMGRGIVLDDVMVRSTPNCLQPHNVRATDVTNNVATLRWLGSYDSEKFLIKVHTDSISTEKLDSAKADAFDGEVFDKKFTKELTDLEQGTTYYAYIKSVCLDESSSWSEGRSFKTSNIQAVPYEESFDRENNPDYPSYLSTWTYGASEGNITPFINTHFSTSAMWHNWSRDSTSSLMFMGDNRGSNSALAPGDYTYCATPEIKVDDISKLQVSFWSRYYTENADHYKLIVGVMTDPKERSTFVSVDTVELTKHREFQEFIVSLSSYTEGGKYIALLAQFTDGTNQFFLDDFKVETTPSCVKAREVRVEQKSAAQATVSWYSEGATMGDIILSESIIKPDTVGQNSIIKGVSNPYTITELNPWTRYYIYARNVRGSESGDWSNVNTFFTPDTILSLPHLIDFEIDTYDPSTYYCPKDGNTKKLPIGIIVLHNHIDPPSYCSNTSNEEYKKSRTDLNLSVLQGKYAYVIFPELPNLKDTKVEFLARLDDHSHSGMFEVGVMDDINDINSFTSLNSFEATLENKYYSVDLGEHSGEDRFFAIRAHNDRDNDKEISVYFDNLIFEEISICKDPLNIKVEPKDILADISWEANDASSWEVRLSLNESMHDSLNSTTFKDYVLNTIITTDSISIPNLKPNETKYYYSIRSVCGEKTGYWIKDFFRTECLYNIPLPYEMDFEGYSIGTNNREFVVPCLFTEMANLRATMNYPYVSNDEYDGIAALCLKSDKETSNYPQYDTYIALPEIGKGISGLRMNDLQLSMMVKADHINTELHVGVMTDPNDLSSFDSLFTIEVSVKNKYEEFILPLTKYTGIGKHIAIRTTEFEKSEFEIDNIKVDYKSTCAKVHSPILKSTTDSTAVLSWTPGDDETQWNLVVSSSSTLTEDQRDMALDGSHEEDIIFAGTVNINPFTVNDLSADTEYYFYVQAKCTEHQNGAWATKAGQFKTDCMILDATKIGVESFDTHGTGSGTYPSCWRVGNIGDPTQKSYIPQCVTAYKHSDKASLQFKTTTTYNGAYAISSRIGIDSIKNLQVSFWGSCNSFAKDSYKQQLIVGVVTSPSDLSSFVPIDTITGYADEQYYTIPLSSYLYDGRGKQGKYVMFLSEFDKSNYFYIDDVRFDTIPECQYPDGMKIDALTHDNIAISWVETSVDSYDIKISTRQLSKEELNAGENPTDAIVFDVHSDEAKAQYKGLKPNTKYYLYAASNCEEEKSWSSVVRFITECLPIYPLPFKEDFNSHAQINPDCWTSYYSYEEKENEYPKIYSTGKTGKGLYVYASSTERQSYAVTPRLDADKLSKYQVAFWVKPNSTSYQRNIIVGVVSDVSTNDSIVSTFIAIDTIKVKSSSYNKYTVPLTEYIGDGKYVVFTTDYNSNLSSSGKGTSGGMYIDDIEIELIPSCAKPESFKVVDISSDYLGLSIVGGPDATSWDIKYVVSGLAFETGEETTVNSRNCKLESLTPNTKYDIYVRTVCGADDKSLWIGPVSTKTVITPISTYPYTCGFEEETENANWILLNDDVNAWNIGDAHKEAGTKALYISKDAGVSAEYDITKTSYSWAMRSVKLEKGEYTFDFDWTCYGDASSDFMRIGLLPTTATFGAGSNIILQDDGISKGITAATSNTPPQWLALEGLSKTGIQLYKLNLVDTTKSLNEQWVHTSVSHIIKEERIYNLVIYWTNNHTTGKRPNPSAVVDNINIIHSGCVKPIELRTDELSDATATVSWTNVGADATEWEVFVTTNEKLESPEDAVVGDTISLNTVNTANVELTNLASKTRYYVFVRTLCGDSKYSSWSDANEFETACSPYEVGHIFGFEESEGYYVPKSANNKAPECFEIGNINKGMGLSAGLYPYMKKSEKGFQYSRTGDYSLCIANTAASSKGSYITLPLINEDIDSLQITFWMRPFDHSKTTGAIARTYMANDQYSKSITIGTMETPDDINSFTKVTEVTYPYEHKEFDRKNINDDPDKNDYWVKYTVPITVESGKYIVFMNNPLEYDKNTLYIDDVTIEKISTCVTPHSLEAINITDKSADITFTHFYGESWDLILSDKDNFSDTIFRDIINTNTYTLNNLKPNSSYYFKVQQLCEEDEKSDWSGIANIQTTASVRFFEDFREEIKRPINWTKATGVASEVFDGSATLSYDLQSSSWNRSSSNVFTDGHQAMRILGASQDYWLITPPINVGEKADVRLTFDIALTDAGFSTPPSQSDLIDEEGNEHSDKMFMVIISDDGGLTWKKENATVWDNLAEGNRSFNGISHTGDNIDIDLSKYVNKQIKVAFYGQSMKKNATIDLHIDNVNINHRSTKDLIDDLCETEDYNLNGFEILSADIKTGENKFSRYVRATTDVADTLYNLTLNVTPMVRYPIEAILCEGEVYSKYGFSTSTLGEHQHKLKADNECDSVVTLNLTLIPVDTTIVEATICQGDEYKFNDKYHGRTGVYYDTLKSNVTFCDSIVILALKVNEAIVAEDYKVVCFGESLDFGKHKDITTSGIYVDTFTTPTGCDSIVTLTVEALSNLDTVLNEVICAGDTYDKNDFKGVSETGTFYIRDLKSDDGCDSLVTLNLTVLSGDTSRVPLTITTDDLPYDYHGKVYPEGTLPGVYIDTINVSADGCDEVIILTLTIELETSIGDIDYTPFSITPNPVHVGESVNVEIGDDLNVISCEVYNATGALINSFSPYSNPIVLNDFNTRGIYMIRLTTDTGEVFVGKVLVK